MSLSSQNLSVAFGAKRVVDGVSFTLDRGETLALVGEMRLRQIAHRALAAAACCRRAAATRPGASCWTDKQMIGADRATLAPGARRRGRHGVPGADDQPQSAAPDRPADRRGGHAASARCRPTALRARVIEVLRPGRLRRRRASARRVPASAFRRPAAAGDDRHGAGQRSGVADRRRTDHGAGRHHPGADPEAAGAAEDGASGWRCC